MSKATENLEAAQKRAQDLMAGAASSTAMHEAKRLLEHSSAQLQLARLKRRHHR